MHSNESAAADETDMERWRLVEEDVLRFVRQVELSTWGCDRSSGMLESVPNEMLSMMQMGLGRNVRERSAVCTSKVSKTKIQGSRLSAALRGMSSHSTKGVPSIEKVGDDDSKLMTVVSLRSNSRLLLSLLQGDLREAMLCALERHQGCGNASKLSSSDDMDFADRDIYSLPQKFQQV